MIRARAPTPSTSATLKKSPRTRLPSMIENSARSSARTGGPAVRFPSVSYWPPWQGQPKPTASTGIRSTLSPYVCLLLVLDRSVRLHRAAEVRAPGVERREARLAVEQAVVADEHRAPRHLADRRILQVGGDHELALGEVLDRPEVDALPLLVRERGQNREAEDRQGDDATDHGAETECARGEERAPRIRPLLILARVRRGCGGGQRRARLGLDRGRRRAHRPRDVADPEEAEDERDHGADHRGDGADDETGEENRDADREADRPEARRRRVRRLVVVRAQVRFPT